MDHTEVAIAGGGIAGLATAYGLLREGVPFRLLEASSRWGGRIMTEREGGFLLEGGPDSMLAQKAPALELCRALGLDGRLLPASEPRTVYVLRRGRLHALPPGMAAGAPSDLRAFLRSRLFSWPGKARMALEALVPPRRGNADESIAGFFRRRLGEEALELLGDPLLAGIHGGHPERLSLGATTPHLTEMEQRFGSLARGLARARRSAPPGPLFYTLRGGLGELVNALLTHLPGSNVHLRAGVRRVRRDGEAFTLEVDGGRTLRARSVVLALPAPLSGDLLAALDPAAAVLLSRIPFASSATVLLGYRREDVGHPLDGHGLLIPRGEGLRTTACTFVSTKFAGRAPEGHVLLRGFIGGVRDPAAVSVGAEGLQQTVQRELAPLLRIRGEPRVARVFLWPASMPQMELGHRERLAALEQRLQASPGLFLTGAGLRGTGIPDGVAEGLRTAAGAARFLAAGRAA